MHPPRLSSDAPEVVRPPHQESPDKYIVRFSERFTHPATHLFQYKPPSSTPSDGRSPELQQGRGQGSPLFDRDTVFPSPPRGYEPRGYDPLPFPNGSQRQEKRRKGRQCGLWVVVVLVVTAFLLGGGIGGGVGGAFALVDESKLSNLQANTTTSSAPSSTTTAPASSSALVVDTAGCPLAQNTTYNSSTSTSYTFITLCSTEILPPTGAPSTSLDISHSAVSSFNACLDACASYNLDIASASSSTRCVGASWVIFDPDDGTRNNGCFLKNGTGKTTTIDLPKDVVSGYVISGPGWGSAS